MNSGEYDASRSPAWMRQDTRHVPAQAIGRETPTKENENEHEAGHNESFRCRGGDCSADDEPCEDVPGRPEVGIVMGSASDWDVQKQGRVRRDRGDPRAAGDVRLGGFMDAIFAFAFLSAGDVLLNLLVGALVLPAIGRDSPKHSNTEAVETFMCPRFD